MAAERKYQVDKRWLTNDRDGQEIMDLAAAAGITPEAAWICLNRGLETASQVQSFLTGGAECFVDPFAFPDMEIAVQAILAAVERGEKILVFGDYDVDGITATTLLTHYLRRIGACVDYYIPDRMEEGYGLNDQAIREAARKGTGLIITVDCGISALEPVALANQLGMTMIVTDHHLPPDQLPTATALINPKIPGTSYPGADLAGVGVAWKLAQALEIRGRGAVFGPEGLLLEYLDLVSLGTVADVVPLSGENRIIVKLGLEEINGTRQRPGIAALLEEAGWSGKKVCEGQLGFLLAPRLNAAGRLASAKAGVELLLSTDPLCCREIAAQLEGENLQRQQVEKIIFHEVEQIICREEATLDRVLVLSSPGWHPGVIGIVASRLMERYHRPAILLSEDGETSKGSGRSIPGFDLSQALAGCSGILLQYGGHKQAAGLKINTRDIPELRAHLNRLAGELLREEDLCPLLTLDVERGIDGREGDIAADLERMAPFGQGNPNPLFAMRDLTVVQARTVGAEGAHLKIWLTAAGETYEAIGFNMGSRCAGLFAGMRLDIACNLEKNRWNGREFLQFVLRDLKPATEQWTAQPFPDGPANSPGRQTAETCPCPDTATEKISLPLTSLLSGTAMKLADARGRAGWTYLPALPAAERAILVYLRSEKRLNQLMAWLQESGEAEGWQPARCGRGLQPWQLLGIKARVSRGEINLLAAETLPETSGRGVFRHLVLFDSPGGPEELRRLLAQLDSEGTVHLCYAPDQAADPAQDGACLPSRELMARIFSAFRRVLTKSTEPMLREGIIQRCRAAGLAELSEETMRQAFRVFTDLTLIREDSIDGGGAVRLVEKPEKVSLEDSAVYRDWQERKRGSHSWQLLTHSPEFVNVVRKMCQ